jgi:polyhydroxyalkanoate synthesis regulator phasin
MKPKGLALLFLLTLVLLTFVESKVVFAESQEGIGNVSHSMTGSSELRRSPAARQVSDDAISMLNVSATQELAKKVEALEEQNSDLQNQAKRLTAVEEQEKATIVQQEDEIATLKAAASENAELKAEIEAMKKAVTKIQEKEDAEVRKVALE